MAVTTTTSTGAEPTAPAGVESEATPRERFVHLAAGLSVAAALIHVAAAPSHSRGYWLFVTLFLLTAVAQLAWGMAVWGRSGDRRLLLAGIVLNLGIVGFWVLSRTAGLPFGPDAGEPVTIHVHDVFATTNELAIAFAAGLALSRDEARIARYAYLIVPLWTLVAFSAITAMLGPHPG